MALVVLYALALAAATPHSPPSPDGFALVVGSNRGGPGQAPLAFAETDARRVRDTLIEVGRYVPGQVELALAPDRRTVLAAIEAAEKKLAARAASGGESTFLFYYSGHARADALNLGHEELGLEDLRARLEALPSKVEVIVLDACQSGAFSRVKGAAPSADFSFNSVQRLNTEGMVVLASSSGSELSQESDSLGASYFTHHLTVALRGAADRDRDGRVSLHEAYQYAYHRTLTSTAETAVGSQHVTLETELRGKGDMILAYPGSFSSQLDLPALLGGEIVVAAGGEGIVVAEIQKASGTPMTLALPAGEYVAILREGDQVRRCEVMLISEGVVALDTDQCAPVEARPGLTKGDGLSWTSGWAVEAAFGFGARREDAFVTTLQDFGYHKENLFSVGPAARFSVSLLRELFDYGDVALTFQLLDHESFRKVINGRDGMEEQQVFDWIAYGVGLYARGKLPLAGGVVVPYVQGGGGVGWGGTELKTSRETDVGYHLGLAAGLIIMPWDHFGGFGQIGYTSAPIITNLAEDTHDSGGWSAFIGLRGEI